MNLTNELKLLVSGVLWAGVVVSPAYGFTIDFETDSNGNATSHGQVIDNEYSAGIPGVSGLTATVSAVNTGGGPDLAVIYDSGYINGRDPDLEAPFNNPSQPGLNQSFNPGNILILQENDLGCSGPNPVFCSEPDDEGSRPAGEFDIIFNKAVTLDSIDFFDINWSESGGIKLYGENDQLLSVYGIPQTGGDNTYARVSLDVDNVVRMNIAMGGSGAIDNIVGSYDPGTPSVPLPGTLLLLGAGAALLRRKSEY